MSKFKPFDFNFKCPKCGKKQEKSAKSNENWECYDVGEKCPDCDVEFKMVIE